MSTDCHITLVQLASAVYGSDGFPTAVRRHLVDPIVQLAARRLALAAFLGGRRVHLDLGNGIELLVQVQPLGSPAGTAGTATNPIKPLEAFA